MQLEGASLFAHRHMKQGMESLLPFTTAIAPHTATFSPTTQHRAESGTNTWMPSTRKRHRICVGVGGGAGGRWVVAAGGWELSKPRTEAATVPWHPS